MALRKPPKHPFLKDGRPQVQEYEGRPVHNWHIDAIVCLTVDDVDRLKEVESLKILEKRIKKIL